MARESELTTAPDFTLRNQKGEETSLGALLKRGPVLLAFHRSTW